MLVTGPARQVDYHCMPLIDTLVTQQIYLPHSTLSWGRIRLTNYHYLLHGSDLHNWELPSTCGVLQGRQS